VATSFSQVPVWPAALLCVATVLIGCSTREEPVTYSPPAVGPVRELHFGRIDSSSIGKVPKTKFKDRVLAQEQLSFQGTVDWPDAQPAMARVVITGRSKTGKTVLMGNGMARIEPHETSAITYAVGVKAPRVAGTFDVSVYLGDALIGLGQLTVE